MGFAKPMFYNNIFFIFEIGQFHAYTLIGQSFIFTL